MATPSPAPTDTQTPEPVQPNPLPIPPNPVITYSDVLYYGQNLVLVKMSIINSLYRINQLLPFQTGFSLSSNSTLVTPGKTTIKCFRGEFIEQKVDANFAGGIYLPPNIETELYLPTSGPEDIVSCLLTPELTFKISFKLKAFGSDTGSERKSNELEITATKPISIRAPTPSATPQSIVTAGAFCSPAGATGVNSSGVKYTCKTSETDTRNRWRQ